MRTIWTGDTDFGLLMKWLVVEAKRMDAIGWTVCGVRRHQLHLWYG